MNSWERIYVNHCLAACLCAACDDHSEKLCGSCGRCAHCLGQVGHHRGCESTLTPPTREPGDLDWLPD